MAVILSDALLRAISRSSFYYPMILPHWPFEPTPDSAEWNPRARVDDATEKGANKTNARFFRDMVHYVDGIVGKITKQLDDVGVRENTLILFTGDNGSYESIVSQFRGATWRGGKSYMTDNGTRNTLIANWPQHIKASSTNHDMVDFSDFLPTLAEAARTPIAADSAVTGRSFFPQLPGEPGQPREWVYCWYFRSGKPADGGNRHSAGEFARDLHYKLYRSGEFYHVDTDRDEQTPLDLQSLTEKQRAIRNKLQQVIDEHTREGFYESNE